MGKEYRGGRDRKVRPGECRERRFRQLGLYAAYALSVNLNA